MWLVNCCWCITTGDRSGKMAKNHQSHSSADSATWLERERESKLFRTSRFLVLLVRRTCAIISLFPSRRLKKRHLKTTFKKTYGRPWPPSVRCVRSWKWWQLWMTLTLKVLGNWLTSRFLTSRFLVPLVRRTCAIISLFPSRHLKKRHLKTTFKKTYGRPWPPPPAYAVYAREDDDNYGWPLTLKVLGNWLDLLT